MKLAKKILMGVVALAAIIGVYYFFTHRSSSYQFVSVARGSITQTISVTGNTVPSRSVSLGFGNSGIVSEIYSAVGERVSAGAFLAALDTGDLSAQLTQAKGNLEAQTAKLQGLKAGSRPEDIAYSEAALHKGEQDLANMYASAGDVSTDAHSKANDAIRTQLNLFFTNSESSQPSLSYNISNPQDRINAESGRVPASRALDDWGSELKNFSVALSPSDIEQTIQQDLSRLTVIRNLISNLSKTLDDAASLSATTLATYQASIGVAIIEVNTAIKNLNTESQNIASQKLIVAQLQATLDLKRAGSTATDIVAAEAEVKQAEASVASIKAKIRNSEIIAPQSGIITQFDAKVGQTATPQNALISIISGDSFEVDAIIPETDIGKIVLNDKVTMTLDAFSGESFSGSVFYIDPAQTNNAGVVGYKIKVAFDKSDTRLKSGLTANLEVETKKKDGVLILPQYAILQTDHSTFVEILESGKVKQIPITLGIQDQKGNVEIVFGVSDGEQVLNIGLKKI